MEFYHLLNRGVDKRQVFMDSRDYRRFLYDLVKFNTLNNVESNNGKSFLKDDSNTDIRCPYFEDERLVDVHFFCLMPNHYHLLVSPLVENGVSLFMKKLNMGYTKYFNERHERSGALWQGKYKSVPVVTDAHFMWIPFYIHFNPLDLKMPEWREGKLNSYKKAAEYLENFKWSSHNDYLGNKTPLSEITNREFFQKYFAEHSGYKKAVSQNLKNLDAEVLEDMELE